MTQDPVVSPLWLTAVWRRLFRPVTVVDRRRIDASATAQRAARRGRLLEPVYGTRRDNAARLLVLLDVGAAMAPWAELTVTLARSLGRESSRLAEVGIHYFAGAPGAQLYARPDLRGAQALSEVLAAYGGGPLLVVGEAGAARPARADFTARGERFFAAALRAEARPIVWLNPMPPSRWPEAFTGLAGRYPHSHCLPLSRESLLNATDLLRGAAT